jgi:hypothetical protein
VTEENLFLQKNKIIKEFILSSQDLLLVDFNPEKGDFIFQENYNKSLLRMANLVREL